MECLKLKRSEIEAGIDINILNERQLFFKSNGEADGFDCQFDFCKQRKVKEILYFIKRLD
jgi:hypothetical protein